MHRPGCDRHIRLCDQLTAGRGRRGAQSVDRGLRGIGCRPVAARRRRLKGECFDRLGRRRQRDRQGRRQLELAHEGQQRIGVGWVPDAVGADRRWRVDGYHPRHVEPITLHRGREIDDVGRQPVDDVATLDAQLDAHRVHAFDRDRQLPGIGRLGRVAQEQRQVDVAGGVGREIAERGRFEVKDRPLGLVLEGPGERTPAGDAGVGGHRQLERARRDGVADLERHVEHATGGHPRRLAGQAQPPRRRAYGRVDGAGDGHRDRDEEGHRDSRERPPARAHDADPVRARRRTASPAGWTRKPSDR